MSGNLSEFLKVLTIVVTMASCILYLRHMITNIDTSNEEENRESEIEESVSVQIDDSKQRYDEAM